MQTPILADDLRTRADQAVHGDDHRVGLLAKHVAGEELLRGGPGADQAAVREPPLADLGERILVHVGQPFPLGSEALVAEAFGEVAAVELDRGFGAAVVAADARFEEIRVEIDSDLGSQGDRFGLDLEDGGGPDPGLRERIADEPQRLPERRRRWPVRLRPELRGEYVARPRPTAQDEQREQCLRVTSSQAHLGPVCQLDLDSTEEPDPKRDAAAPLD